MHDFTSLKVEEFYNHVHDAATGRFSGRAASGRAGFREASHSSPYGYGSTKIRGAGKSTATPENFPRGDKRKGAVHVTGKIARMATAIKSRGGHPVTGAQLPLRNATTGRINPTQVRAAFRTTGFKSAGSKRTEHIGSTPVTSKTVKGRKIQHVSTGGKPVKPMGMGHRWTAATHTKTVKAQRNLLAETIARVRAGANG